MFRNFRTSLKRPNRSYAFVCQACEHKSNDYDEYDTYTCSHCGWCPWGDELELDDVDGTWRAYDLFGDADWNWPSPDMYCNYRGETPLGDGTAIIF